MIRKGVDDLGAGEDVETDEKNIIGQQHESTELIGPATLPEYGISKIANVFDVRVLHDIFVHGHGGEPEKNAGQNHGNYSRNPS